MATARNRRIPRFSLLQAGLYLLPSLFYNHVMSDQPVPPPPSPPPEPITEFQIGEEFGTAKRNLPPAGIVLICIAAVAVIVGIFATAAMQIRTRSEEHTSELQS